MIRSGNGFRTLRKDKLVTAQAATNSTELNHFESVFATKLKYRFRLRYLKRISAQPVKQISEIGHAPRLLVLGVAFQGVLQQDQVFGQASEAKERTTSRDDGNPPPNAATVAPFHGCPNL